MARLKIYGIARTRAFRVLWMANELGLDYEHIPIETGPAGAHPWTDYPATYVVSLDRTQRIRTSVGTLSIHRVAPPTTGSS